MNADMHRGRWFVVFVSLERHHTDRVFLGSDMKLMARDFPGIAIYDRRELEQLRSQPDRLLTVFFVNSGPTTQLLKIAAVSLFPKHCAIAQDDAGHLRQPRREFGFELAVLLINRRELARVRQRLTRKATEILVLAHFGVVNVALAPDPLQQGLSLRGSRVTTKTIADLHDVIIIMF